MKEVIAICEKLGGAEAQVTKVPVLLLKVWPRTVCAYCTYHIMWSSRLIIPMRSTSHRGL